MATIIREYYATDAMIRWYDENGETVQGTSNTLSSDEDLIFTVETWVELYSPNTGNRDVTFSAPNIKMESLIAIYNERNNSINFADTVVNFDDATWYKEPIGQGKIIFSGDSKLNLTSNSNKLLIICNNISGTITLDLDDSFVSGSTFSIQANSANNLVINNADGYEVSSTTDGTLTTYTVNRVIPEVKEFVLTDGKVYKVKDETARNGLKDKQDVIPDLEEIRQGAEKGETAVQPNQLSTVATSGNYNDLSNKPTIPTVNNGTLTIQKNGTTVATFSANQSGNVTANIEADTQVNADWNATSGVAQILNKPTIPTKTSELTDDSGFAHLAETETFTGEKTFTQPMKIQNGQGTGSLWIGGNVNSSSLTNRQRHLARIVVPSFGDVTVGATLLGFDSSGDSNGHTENKTYDSVVFGGSKKITNATSPMNIIFCVTKERGSTSASDKVYPLEMDGSEARFNVQPNYNGADLATQDYVDGLVGDIETALNNINSGG